MFAVAVLSIGLSVAVQAGLLTSGCERCHLVLHDGPSRSHVTEWTTSEHATHRVGCVRCHNGDAVSDESLEAHRFVLPARMRASTVHPMQLPATCGQCHPREATRFTSSRHGALLASGADRAPSCGSCHGAMNAAVPSPERLQAACAACHLDDPGRDAFPSDARVLTEWLGIARARLRVFEQTIAREANETTRRQLWDASGEIETSLRQAGGALHAFDLAEARSALMLARERTRQADAYRSAGRTD